jgi:hypothetical protein
MLTKGLGVSTMIRMTTIFTMFLLVFSTSSVFAQQIPVEVITQFFGGYLAGAAGGIILFIPVNVLNPPGGCIGEAMGEALMNLFIGGTPGIILASSGSVYCIGEVWGHRNGSFRRTLCGALVPPLLGVVSGAIIAVKEEGAQEIPVGLIVGAFFGSLLSPIGAITGYHLSTQPKRFAAMPFERYSSSHMKNGDRTVVVPLLQIRF